MKLSPKISRGASARREQLVRERTQAVPLALAFPRIGQLRIELSFNDSRGRAHSPQVHTLYPAARSFFRFACACTDCDGDFDLEGAVKGLLKDSSKGTRSARGTLICDGTRRDLPQEAASCSIRIDYQLTSTTE